MTLITSPLDYKRAIWKQRYNINEIPERDVLDRYLDKTKAKFFYSGSKMKGWLGSLICNHKYIWDEWCATAWCDGETIAFNPWFFMACTWNGRVSVLVHENWHTGADHFGRRGSRDPGTWNTASDHWINTNMIDDGFSWDPNDVAGIEVYANMEFKNMHSEQIYDILKRDEQSCPSNGNGEGPEMPSDGSEGDPSQGDAYAAAAGPQEEQNVCSGDMREPPKNSGAEDARMRKIIGAMQASEMSKDAGIIPGDIRRHIDEWLNPVLPWESLLERWYTELATNDFSFRKPNRRYEDEYLPSMLSDDGLEHLIFYVDASASVTPQELKLIGSEAHSIHKNINPNTMTVVAFDTEIQGEWTFDADDSFDSLPIEAGGGTCLECVYEDIIKRKPSGVVILSDMHVSPMKQNPDVPILWVIVANPDATVPFGQTVHISKEQIQKAFS